MNNKYNNLTQDITDLIEYYFHQFDPHNDVTGIDIVNTTGFNRKMTVEFDCQFNIYDIIPDSEFNVEYDNQSYGEFEIQFINKSNTCSVNLYQSFNEGSYYNKVEIKFYPNNPTELDTTIVNLYNYFKDNS